MREEAEIMDELHDLDGQIKEFPPDAHWFCPRRSAEDLIIDYDNLETAEEDMSPAEKLEIINKSKERHKIAYQFSLIVGLGDDITGSLRDNYILKLDEALATCDKCVRNWHKGRKRYLKYLSEQFDENTVGALAQRLSDLDFARINNGLLAARKLLAGVDRTQRNQQLLANNDPKSLMALFEVLCCPEYHNSNERLALHFDYVFAEVQNKKVIRMRDALPAMTRFLFDTNPYRQIFASSAWSKMQVDLTPELFEWVVHDALSSAIVNLTQTAASQNELEIFWKGLLQIVEKLDQDIITHSLRAMEVQPNIYELGLQHLSSDSVNIVGSIINTFDQLLFKSPKDFWQSMGTISPAVVAEQIFLSPAYNKMLLSMQGGESDKASLAFIWVPNFIASLPAVHQFEACRSLLNQFLQSKLNAGYSEAVQVACYRAGLVALNATLNTFLRPEYIVNPSTSLIVINDIIGLVNFNKEIICSCADMPDNTPHPELKQLGMLVIKNALALDCKAVNAEYTALDGNTPVQRVTRNHSQSLWQAVLDIFRPGNLELAKSILIATTDLIGLDNLLPRTKREKLSRDHAQFNKDFGQLNDIISRVFQRLSDFKGADLRQLSQDLPTSRPLFAALLSSDKFVCEAAGEVIKSMATFEDGQTVGRQEAFGVILNECFANFLSAMVLALHKVMKYRTFTPAGYMLALGKELLDALCGSTGALRSRTSLTIAEQHALSGWWRSQWRTLDMIFSTTEAWATRVDRPTNELQNFCRDAMEYAEALFDQYTVIASVGKETTDGDDPKALQKPDASRNSTRKVLDVICHNINGLTMMLRLRDFYLISVITKLISKLLRCLGDYDLEIDEFASEFIKGACRRDDELEFKRTNLSKQQKAELQRALDEHQGLEIIEMPAPAPAQAKTQISIESWSKSAGGQRHEPTLPAKTQTQLAMKSSDFRKAKPSQPVVTPAQTSRFNNQIMKDKNFKEKRKQAEDERQRLKAEAIAKAKALRVPLVKGEGSGMQSLNGIVGKDHAPVRSEIMVGSSDEDSDEESDGETHIIRRKGASKSVAEYEESRRLARLKEQQGPVRKTKVQRSAKDLRARVEPNMDSLYLEILNWDIFHSGDKPPSNSEYRRIDNKYLDLDLYKRTFGPLLISEVWRSLVTAKDENNYKPVEIRILNRLSVDKFMEVNTTMPIALNRDVKLSERDIVLLSRSSNPLNDQDEPHCLARVDRTTRKKDAVEVTYRISRETKAAFLQCIVPNGKINALKIADMTTTQREFAALSSLEYYDLCNEVLEAKPSPIQNYSDERVLAISSKFNLNRGQARAILSANDNDGFTLIQGPPGTGKTKTIVAMVGALITPILDQQKQEQFKARPIGQATNVAAAAPSPKKKLLICAPSNAAVDELVVRLMEGVQPLNGPTQKINVIRIGRSDAINASVKSVMLDELVRVKLEGDNGEQNKLIQEKEKLHQDAGKIKERLNEIRPLMDAARASGDKPNELNLQREFDQLKRTQAQIGSKIDAEKNSGNTMSRQNEINRRRFQQEIIDGAHVLCATLSGSGHDMFRNLNVEFETVIIDEAAQCIELSALIPLKYGCSKCILVGDPEQLPPTVLSRSAQSYGYEQSLFVRMQKNHPKDVHLLDTQYRMHPEISFFPSREFYHSRLVDGDGMAKLRVKPWHSSSVLAPYRFFDVKGVQTKEAKGHSFINIQEINAAIKLYARLKADYRDYDFRGKIGIIASYKAQLNELKLRFARQYGDDVFEEIEFNTTDAFQGREREIIIFSCVRAKATGGIGFLGDIRRMNVGLTRAKSSLWVLGDSRSLQQGEFWNKLIEDAKVRDRYTGGDVMELFSKPTSRDAVPVQSNSAGRVMHTDKDGDVEMNDLSTPGSPKAATDSSSDSALPPQTSTSSSGAESKRETAEAAPVASKPRPVVKQEARKPVPGLASLGINQHGKRKREPPTPTEDVMAKDARPLKVEKKAPDLNAVWKEAEEQKAALAASKPAPPTRPQGPPPPRKKAPVDPFIQRKKPQRRPQ